MTDTDQQQIERDADKAATYHKALVSRGIHASDATTLTASYMGSFIYDRLNKVTMRGARGMEIKS